MKIGCTPRWKPAMSYSLLSVKKNNDRPVGSVYFRDIDHDNKKAEYGIFIGEADAAGRGIGSETARLAADYARDVLKLHKLMLRVFADNVGGSQKLPKRRICAGGMPEG